MIEPAALITTRVRVRDLSLLADVGINPEEIGRQQPLVISVELLLDVGAVSVISDTIDYRAIARTAEKLAKVHIPLIETLAYQLGHECMRWPSVVEATVDVDKPFALTRSMARVQVTVIREGVPQR